MANLFRNDHFRAKFWDTLFGVIGGVIGALMVNMAFLETRGVYLLFTFVLPGALLGGTIGFFLGRVTGRGFAAIASMIASFIMVLVLLLLLLARVTD